MALSSMTNLIAEISDRVGTRAELTGGSGGDGPTARIERAVNDALQEVVLTYKLAQYEAEPSWYFKSSVYSDGTASNTALDVAVTGSGTDWSTSDGTKAQVGWLFKYDSESVWHEIISISTDTAMIVSPRITAAHTAGTYTIIANRFAFPTTGSGSPSDVFSIFDVRDVETQRRIKPADNRLLDKNQLATGNPYAYTRWKDSLQLWPAPDLANIYYRVRYIKRPAFVATGATTLSPLPEEWQEVVVLLATSKVLASLMELDRSTATKVLAKEKASELMIPGDEESEDYDFALRPSPMMTNRSDAF